MSLLLSLCSLSMQMKVSNAAETQSKQATPELVMSSSLAMLFPHLTLVFTLQRTLSVESQLQGKRLRWLGHVFRMPNDRLPKKLLFGEVKGLRPPGRPRSSFNDVALRDCQNCRISRPYRDAQDRLLWRDKTCPART